MHTPTFHSLAVCTALAFGAAACGSDEEFAPPPPFTSSDDVQVWATSASAVAVYSTVNQHMAAFDGQPGYPDAECPLVEDDGTTWSASGDCTDSEGEEWTGQVTIERDGDDRLLTFHDFNGHNGTFSLHQVEVGLHEFEAQLAMAGGTTIDYIGSVQGGYDERTLWNGSGHVERDGFFSPNGAVDATTLNEIVDNDVCAGQPVSGTTTLTAGEDVAVITYDGETDCDSDENAGLSVNDEDRGLIAGINCSVAAPAGSGAAAAATVVGLLAAAFGWRRRRARR